MFVQTGLGHCVCTMGRHWSAVCVVILALAAYVLSDTAPADADCSVKSGLCPPRNWGMGMCAEYCRNDSDCPGNEKCCSNGCGHQCMVPYTVKRGRCPLPQATHMCAEFCDHDGQCEGKQKCCRTTCGKACTDPC